MKKAILWLPNKYFDWRNKRWRKHYSEYSKEELIEEVMFERHEKIALHLAIITIMLVVLAAISI